MSVIARRFASTPARTSGETWERIVSVISKSGSEARRELHAVGGLAASIIADETPRDVPIVVMGNRPRLRMYCVYGEDAVIGDECDERELTSNPTEGEWRLFLPCAEEDLEWVKSALQQRSRRILAYEAEKGEIPETNSQGESGTRATFSVNIKEFLER
jgi:hypothetical protein